MVPDQHYYVVEDFEDGTLTSSTGRIDRHPLVAAVSENQRAEVLETPYARQLTSGGGKPGQGYPMVRVPAYGVAFRGREDGIAAALSEDVAPAMRSGRGSASRGSHALVDSAVRRLTPRECERLQGFPDDWTALGPDSRRYAALGDAVTVPVAEWVGRRLMAHVKAREAA